MFTKKPLNCPITDNKESKLIYVFKKPPFGETKFKIKGSKVYLRELWQFLPSKHLISVNHMNIDTSYEGSYVEATYQNNEKLKSTFKKIISLPNNKSDNKGRVKIIKSFASNWFKLDEKPYLLDIGSGLGVFPYEIEKLGWKCLSIDPDKNSVKHIKEIGINANNFNNIIGKESDYNSEKIKEIFQGTDNDFSVAVCLNAAAGLIVADKTNSFKEGYAQLRQHILSGKVADHLSKLVK